MVAIKDAIGNCFFEKSSSKVRSVSAPSWAKYGAGNSSGTAFGTGRYFPILQNGQLDDPRSGHYYTF